MGWPMVYHQDGKSEVLITTLKNLFITFGIPEELASDGGPQFMAYDTHDFLLRYGVHHCHSSMGFPHRNCHTKVGVKTVKRMLESNIGPDGELDMDKFQRVILMYHTTWDPATGTLPAMAVFGREIRDFIQILAGCYRPSDTWSDLQHQCESALHHCHQREVERLSKHTHCLPPLKVGYHIQIQNQLGNNPSKWDNTGIIIEVQQHDQYILKVDGSGQIMPCNIKFQWKFIPFMLQRPVRQLPEAFLMPTNDGDQMDERQTPAEAQPQTIPHSGDRGNTG